MSRTPGTGPRPFRFPRPPPRCGGSGPVYETTFCVVEICVYSLVYVTTFCVVSPPLARQTIDVSHHQDSMETSSEKLVDFLLPTGILIPLSCSGSQTVEEVKDRLWKEAKKFPLYGLKQPEWYTLVFVNLKAEQEECLDESQRLADVQMYKPLFKVH